jgi:hypothetical protein
MKPSSSDPAILEAALNAALLGAEISRGYEEYLVIVDSFYADDVEANSEGLQKPVVGKRRLQNVLMQWLLPLHVMTEIGGLNATLRLKQDTGTDVIGTKHSTWTLELIGISGSRCSLTWSCVRTWRHGVVASEFHYNYQRTGAPLGINDVRFADQLPGGVYDNGDV